MMKIQSHFSSKEVKDISLALVALAFSFQLILFRNEIFVQGQFSNIALMLIYFLQSLVVVGLAFVLHELGHKYIAQKKGLWAEFRAWPAGLGLAVLLAVVSRGGFVFAAPGAVMIAPGRKHRQQYMQELAKRDIGEIGIIGVVINIIMAFAFIALALIAPTKIFNIGAQVNAWLAIFNLIPFNPLDGAKVMFWDKKIWLGVFLLSIFVFALTIILI
jgi:Zn-dependent protease